MLGRRAGWSPSAQEKEPGLRGARLLSPSDGLAEVANALPPFRPGTHEDDPPHELRILGGDDLRDEAAQREPEQVLQKDERNSVRRAEPSAGEADAVGVDERRRRGCEAVVRHGAFPPSGVVVYLAAVLAVEIAACSITRTTSFGCVTNTTWLALISVVFAPIRLA